MNAPPTTPDTRAKLATMMIILATRRVRDVLQSETAELALLEGELLLAAIKDWFVNHDNPHLFASHQQSAEFNKCRDLAQRLATRVIVSLRRVHNRPPKYSRATHNEVWKFWVAICELRYCPLNRKRLSKKKM